MRNKRILFILKRKQDYGERDYSHNGLSTGLYNSAKYVSEMLTKKKVENKVVVVVDNNCIDREVKAYKPTHVIIEALWVVPEKFHVLQRLHPTVKWIIRTHSETPFIANEGVSMEWLARYTDFTNVMVACNSKRFLKDLRFYIKTRNGYNKKEVEEKILYLPNNYPTDKMKPIKSIDKNLEVINVSSFGAIRPLKNQLTQAMAAVQFAEKVNKKVHFHVNGGRIEQKGDNVLRNLVAFFDQLSHTGHKLVIHGWLGREDFIDLCRQMDIALQVSFSETFNIVAADHVSQGVPVIGSEEITWIAPKLQADPTDVTDIRHKIEVAYYFTRSSVGESRTLLKEFVKETEIVWTKYFNRRKIQTV